METPMSSEAPDGSESSQVTLWLLKAAAGDEQARDRAYRLVRERLKQIARKHMSQADFLEFSITTIADDAYLKLINLREVAWQDRLHFLRFACSVVRQLLTDHARRRLRQKRNSGQKPLDLASIAEPVAARTPEQTLALHEALDRLGESHPELAEVVELQYFGGWTQEEIATEILNLPLATVRRRWTQARTLLHARLSDDMK